MQNQASARRLIARLLIASTTSLFASPAAHAATIATETAVASDRERILVLVDRPEVSVQLEAFGVSPADAKARIAALTDEEAAQLAAGIDTAPAGGFIPAIAGALVVVGYAIVAGVALVAASMVGIVRAISRS